MKILVPTDFSDNAAKALDFAKTLALKNQASITLLYTFYAVYDFAAQATEIISQIEYEAKKDLKKLVAEGKEEGIKMDYRILQGSVASTVTSMAYQEEYDLIVMGTQGASGIKKALIGSNTGHVIKESKVPVVAVPAAANLKNISQVAVALELNKENERYFKQIFSLTSALGVPYTFFHIELNESFEKQIEFKGLEVHLKEKYPNLKLNFQLVRASDLDHGISTFLNLHPGSLLTMISKSKNFYEYLFNKSQSLQMAYHTHAPLLVVK
jgi:nucleotide-binding universal stress UspA family protein